MGFQSLLAAASDGDGQELRKCIEGLDTDRDGLFNRHDPVPAVIVGQEKGIHGRYNRPSSASETGSMGEAVLHKAAADGRLDMCAYIIAAANECTAQVGEGGAGALLRQRNSAGQTPLMLACLKGSLPTVNLLVQAGSDLEGGDDINGLPPLHCAVRNGHVFIVQALLDAKADPNSTDGMGGTALHVASRYNISDAIDILAEAGCSLDLQRFSDHFTALHLACKYNSTPNTVQALLQARADPGLVSRAGYPPAYLATRRGVKSVIDFMNQTHWEQLLKNRDKEGLTRLREGGQLTVRASFDKAMQRLSCSISDPSGSGLWWDPNAVVEEAGEYEGFIVRVDGGLPSGRWVSKGPMPQQELEKILDAEMKACIDMLKSKVCLFTSEEKVQELVLGELTEPLATIRDVNALWIKGKEHMESFKFSEALAVFQSASRKLENDWWASRAAGHAQSLVDNAICFRSLKDEADKKMGSGSRLRTVFQFAQASVWYTQAAPIYAEIGHLARYSEATYRLREMDEKAELEKEASAKMDRCKQIVSEYCPVEIVEGKLEPFPPTRLQLQEGLSLLVRCVEIYKGYGDYAMQKRAEARLKANTWSLERQSKAQRLMSTACLTAREYKSDALVKYTPSESYAHKGNFHRLCFADSVSDFEMAGTLYEDFKDMVNLELSRSFKTEMLDKEERLMKAIACLQMGQAMEASHIFDLKLKGIVVFGATPMREGDPPRQPYVRHAVPEDYPLADQKQGVQFHRLMLDEAVENFEQAKRLFELISDHDNAAEAKLREESAIAKKCLQQDANEAMMEGQMCVKNMQYFAGHEKYAKAAGLFQQVMDEVNAQYASSLVADAGAKKLLGEEALHLMGKGRELLARREKFTKWQDVVVLGLQAFSEAEDLFCTAAELFLNLDDAAARRNALEAQTEAGERKIHAQEIKTCRCIVVQPGGDWAPQRRDKIRRTMPYPSAQHAIKDAATDGKTSTYHTKADIRSGSTIYLRAGNHEMEEMLIIRRGITIAAEDGVEADSCLMMIEEHCLVQVRAPSVRLENITMRQVLGDGDEDYWSGGLFVIKAVAGSVEMNRCVITSDRGSGVVVTGSGTAVMTKCQVLDCGHYGVAADGKDALIDLRDCQVDGSKFEDYDERNGARIVGIPGRE